MAESLIQSINAYFAEMPAVSKACESLGVKPAFLVLVSVAFALPFLLFGIGGGSLANLIAALFPAYQTFVLLERLKADVSGGGLVSAAASAAKDAVDGKRATSTITETISAAVNAATGAPSRTIIEEMVFYLQYWTTFAFILYLESFAEWFLYWIPMWHLLKIGLTVWLFHPSWRGAAKVYEGALAPQLRNARPTIDAMLVKAGSRVSQALRNASKME